MVSTTTTTKMFQCTFVLE